MATEPKRLQPAPPEKIKAYWEKARKFIETNGFYGSVKWQAECAVAEYIAYQEGYTIRIN